MCQDMRGRVAGRCESGAGWRGSSRMNGFTTASSGQFPFDSEGWKQTATRRRRTTFALIPTMALALLALTLAGCGGGGGKKTPTTDSAIETSTPEPDVNAGLKSPIPVSPGDLLTDDDLAARGVGEPGRGDFTGVRLIIPAIGVDAPFSN